MTRRLLAATMSLGLLVSAMGFSGIYAVFSDRATTGENSISSGEMQRVAELKIATAASPFACATATYSDDLLTGIFTATDVQAGFDSSTVYVCLRNDGSGDLAVTWSAIDIADVETACTGDEAAAGDTSCTVGGAGELSEHILITSQHVTCDGSFIGVSFGYLDDLAVAGISPGTVSAGGTMCFTFRAGYGGVASDTLSLTERLLAQSDQVTWRLAFDGSAP